MSLARRWLDPIRSRWFFNRPYRQRHLSSRDGLTVYLRFDDVYSYLLVQLLPQLEELLVERLKPIKIMISDQDALPPNQLSTAQWRDYSMQDAAVLARQHRFVFDAQNVSIPTLELMQQAREILSYSPLKSVDYLQLLQDVFHMLWQNQQGKLRTLHYMAMQRVATQPVPLINASISFTDQPMVSAFLLFGGRQYRAIDDFLRLTRRLKRQKLFNNEPIFLINHIEWGEHLVSDPEILSEIQAIQATLEVYATLEDPATWLILAYIKRELCDYYNLSLIVHPLPYQDNDDFDWALMARLSRRAEVDFAPFCRPDAAGVMNMARLIYALDAEQRSSALLEVLRCIWCRGLDAEFEPHLRRLQNMTLDAGQQLADLDATTAWLEQNQRICQQYNQPDLPVMVLTIGEQNHVFNSLYRVWCIESLLAEALETTATS